MVKYIKILLAIGVLLAVMASSPLAAAGEAVGRITSVGASLDGVKVPSGTTLLSPALVVTAEQMAIVHLPGGNVVNLAPQTTAHVESLDRGLIGISVDEGSVVYLSDSGKLTTLTALDRAVFEAGTPAAQQQEIGEGEKVEEVRLCELRNADPEKFSRCSVPESQGGEPDANECRWRLLVVPPSEVGNYLSVTSVRAGGQLWEDVTGNEIGLNNDCDTEALALLLPKAAVIAGGVVGGAVLFDAIDAEEEISPTQP